METEKLLAEFMGEIASMDATAFAPNHGVDTEDKEIVIGECTDTERKLYALHRMYSKMRDQHKVEAKYHTAEEGCSIHAVNIEEYHAKQTIFLNLLWYSIEKRLKIFGETENQYAIRENWAIVKSPTRNKMPPGLRALLGGLGGDE